MALRNRELHARNDDDDAFSKNETTVERQFTFIYVHRLHGGPLFSVPLCRLRAFHALI